MKHFHLSHLKAIWRSFEGSISKSFKHTVQTSSGRITWGRGEDILQTGVFSILKTIYERVQKFQPEQIEGVMGAFWRLFFQMVSRHLHILWLEVKIKTFWRREFFKSQIRFLNIFETFRCEQFEGVTKTYWKQHFQRSSMHIVDVFKSHNLKSRWRRSRNGSFSILKRFQDMSNWRAFWGRFEDCLLKCF